MTNTQADKVDVGITTLGLAALAPIKLPLSSSHLLPPIYYIQLEEKRGAWVRG